jgi:hypothetical protein
MTQVPFSTPAPAAPTRRNPLQGTPISDWVRDATAVALLLVSLALPWTVSTELAGVVVGAGRTEVILITILSVLSIAVTYLARFGVLGTGATLSRIVGIRAALNAPYVILVIVYMILDATGASGGLGNAAALGLAGALLAAGTRDFEVRSQAADSPVVRASFAVVAVSFVLIVLTSLIGMIIPIATYAAASPTLLTLLVVPFLEAIGIVALFGLVLRRSETARLVSTGIGIVVLVTILIDAVTRFVLSGGEFGIESLRLGGYPTIWLAAAAAILGAPSVRSSMHPVAPLTAWFSAAKQSFLVIVIVGAVLAVLDVFVVIDSNGVPVGLLIGLLLCHVLAVVAALIGRIQLVGDPAHNKTTVLGIASGIAIVAIVATVLGSVAQGRGYGLLSSSIGEGGIPGIGIWAPLTLTLVGLFGPAAIVGYSLLIPSPVREYYSQVAGVTPASTAHAYPMTGAAAVPAASSVNPLSSLATAPTPEARRAADPATPAAELHGYATDRALWPYLASNPALYPDMVVWLEATGDPEVLAILRARS